MPNCILRYCKNYSQRTKKASDGITFHKFPRGGQEREEWIRFVQNDRCELSWLPSVHTRICSEHFSEQDCYITKTGRRYLKKNAIPLSYPIDELLEVNLSVSESIFNIPREFDLKQELEINKTVDIPREIELKKEFDINTTDDIPREIELKKDLEITAVPKNNLFAKSKKNKEKHNNIKTKKQNLTDIIKTLKSNFPVEYLLENETKLLKQAAVIETLTKSSKKKRKFTKKVLFSPCVRKFALTLNYYSAAAYKYVTKAYKNALPHPRTLFRWYESVEAEPGFTVEAFKALKLKSAKDLPEKPVICSLVFDVMPIRQQKFFKHSKIGLVNFGTGPQEEKASQVLVFMLVSLTENWKIPVGYFLASSISAETKTTLIKICLTKCHRVGVRVINLTFDACKTNFRALEALGCKFSDVTNMKTYFRHPSTFENVYVFVDPCHVIKLIRNAFENKRIFFDENKQKVKWQLLVNLNKLRQNEGFRFANNPSLEHIHFRNQIMKVKLGTQLLSASVAEGLELCDKTLESSQFWDSDSTVYFINLINNLFDVLNSQRCHFHGYKSPLCNKNKEHIFNFLKKAKAYILALQVQVKQIRIIKRPNRDRRTIINLLKKSVIDSQVQTGFIGAIICIESLKKMFLEMVEERGIMSYISTHRLSQDHLDLFFGCIRNHGGHINHPNVRQFRAAYKKILSHLELRPSFTDYCIPIDNFTILTTTSVNIINSTSGTNRHEDEDFHVYQNDSKLLKSDISSSVNCQILAGTLDDVSLTCTAELIVGYISGYVARKLVNILKCEECVMNLTTNKKIWYHKLIGIKDMGGPCYSSVNVFQVCLETETFIRTLIRENGGRNLPEKYSNINYIVANTLKVFLNSTIFDSMTFHALQQPATLNHRTHLIRAIIEKYSQIRLHHEARCDPEISFYMKRQKFTTLILFDNN